MGNTSQDFKSPQEILEAFSKKTNELMNGFAADQWSEMMKEFTHAWNSLSAEAMNNPSKWMDIWGKYQQENMNLWLKLIDIPLFILPGILAFVLIPNLTNSTDAYLQLVKHIFPPGLIGLVVVVMIAALVSTVGSALNSLSTVFTMDIYLKNKTNVKAKRIKRIGRVVVLIGSLLSVFLAVGISFIQGLSFFNIFFP